MINPEDALYAPHPTEDIATQASVTAHLDYLTCEKGNPETFLQQVTSYQYLRLTGVMEDVILGDTAFTELHRAHIDYVYRANNGGELSPAYEAELIVAKAVVRGAMPPEPLAA